MTGVPDGGRRRISAWEIAAALFLLGLGGFMIWQGIAYGVGTVRRMGPGFFPVAVGALLALLSLGILAELRRRGGGPLRLPYRPLALIMAALMMFAVTVEPLGIVPSTILLVLVGSFADRDMTLLRAAANAVVLAAVGYTVFILAFGLPLSPFWW